MSSIISSLDNEQKQVATIANESICVYAGAGTGKTRAITHRIAYGVNRGFYEPSEVLAVTFTKKAAIEMAERLIDLGVVGVNCSTVHSFALSILRKYFKKISKNIQTPKLVNNKKKLLHKAALETKNEADEASLKIYEQEISYAKSHLYTEDEYFLKAEKRIDALNFNKESIRNVMLRYNKILEENGLIDFDDLLHVAAGMLLEYPEILKEVQDKLKVFCIDEYQDISPLQHSLLKIVMGTNYKSYCVVGDPNQTIYSFAGASSNFLENEAKKIKLVKLYKDYRSTQPIVDLANKVIGPKQTEKLKLVSGISTGGIRPRFNIYKNDFDEVEQIFKKIKGLKSDKTLAILYRTNAQGKIFSDFFKENKVEHTVFYDEPKEKAANLVLSTIHAAKGLEWDCVFIIGLSEKLMPISMATTKAEIDEEKRLLYVGITRAKSHLELSYAKLHADSGTVRKPSRFLVDEF